VYAPIYDSSLITVGVILTFGALADLDWRNATRWMVALAAVTYATSWVTAGVARAHGIQLLTIVLFVFGIAGNLFLQKAVAVPTPMSAHS